MSTKEPDLISEVEWFVDSVKKRYLVVSEKAQTITWRDFSAEEGSEKGTLWGRAQRNLGECFGHAWEEWEEFKDNPTYRMQVAKTLNHYIKQLYAYTCIDEGDGLLGKVEEAETKISELTRHNELLSSELKQLQEEKRNFWKEKKKLQKDMK